MYVFIYVCMYVRMLHVVLSKAVIICDNMVYSEVFLCVCVGLIGYPAKLKQFCSSRALIYTLTHIHNISFSGVKYMASEERGERGEGPRRTRPLSFAFTLTRKEKIFF